MAKAGGSDSERSSAASDPGQGGRRPGRGSSKGARTSGQPLRRAVGGTDRAAGAGSPGRGSPDSSGRGSKGGSRSASGAGGSGRDVPASRSPGSSRAARADSPRQTRSPGASPKAASRAEGSAGRIAQSGSAPSSGRPRAGSADRWSKDKPRDKPKDREGSSGRSSASDRSAPRSSGRRGSPDAAASSTRPGRWVPGTAGGGRPAAPADRDGAPRRVPGRRDQRSTGRPDQRSTGRPEQRSTGRTEERSGGRPTADRRASTRRESPAVRDPEIPPSVTAHDLDRVVRAQLSSLPAALQDIVGGHIVMAGRLIDEDPERAHEHAQAAVRRAARLAVVREAAGLTAYATRRWDAALAELRAYRRISGSDAYVAVEADCERGRGRPDRALELARGPRADRVDRPTQIELAIVEAGARRDQGQAAAAVVVLQLPELRSRSTATWSVRLRYAYADALEAAGRHVDAREWFERAAAIDGEDETDAAARAELLSAPAARESPPPRRS